MTDRELLEDAAKAAGMNVLRSRLDDPMWRDMLLDARPAFPQTLGWNPLEDDGDALRLACAVAQRHDTLFKIGIAPQLAKSFAHVGEAACRELHLTDDLAAATRRAIVRAAAAMKETP